jgi:peroxiredoxin
LYAAFHEQGFVLLGISVDRIGVEEMQRFAKAEGLSFPIALDAQFAVAQSYGVRGTPTTFLIDRKNRVIGGTVGPRAWDSDVAKQLMRHLLQE